MLVLTVGTVFFHIDLTIASIVMIAIVCILGAMGKDKHKCVFHSHAPGQILNLLILWLFKFIHLNIIRMIVPS